MSWLEGANSFITEHWSLHNYIYYLVTVDFVSQRKLSDYIIYTVFNSMV